MLKKENGIKYLVFGIFLIIGLLFFILGICIVVGENIDEEDRVYTTAIIENIIVNTDSDGDSSYDVFISYFVDEKLLKKQLNSYSSDYYEGKEIEIYYDKNNPSKVRAKNSNFGLFIFSGLGLIVFLVGTIGIISTIIKTIKRKNLRLNGKIIYATYIETILNTSYNINGRNPYNIICEWNDPVTNKKYIFKSENIWFNPDNVISQNNINQFRVFINPNNIKEYVLDISMLEKQVVDLT